jgi:hypothetical protein
MDFSIYSVIVHNNCQKYQVAYQKYDVYGKYIVTGIEDHSGDQDGQKHHLEYNDPPGYAHLAESPACHRITLSMIVVRTHHKIGGMGVKTIQQDKCDQKRPE